MIFVTKFYSRVYFIDLITHYWFIGLPSIFVYDSYNNRSTKILCNHSCVFLFISYLFQYSRRDVASGIFDIVITSLRRRLRFAINPLSLSTAHLIKVCDAIFVKILKFVTFPINFTIEYFILGK